MVIVVMGVSGSGKSTIGKAWAEAEHWDFQEGDELHSQANIDKMRAGQPLNDDDRRPWLDRVVAWIADELGSGHDGVITCSALKRDYRDRLRHAGSDVRFVDIRVSRAVLEQRLRERRHFMPASLLQSQLQTLEPPIGESDVCRVSGDEAIGDVMATIARWVEGQRGQRASMV
jgi:carbohydrate kinase (thermoresistant glucokinase family)